MTFGGFQVIGSFVLVPYWLLFCIYSVEKFNVDLWGNKLLIIAVRIRRPPIVKEEDVQLHISVLLANGAIQVQHGKIRTLL
jgi:hypothetical protein